MSNDRYVAIERSPGDWFVRDTQTGEEFRETGERNARLVARNLSTNDYYNQQGRINAAKMGDTIKGAT